MRVRGVRATLAAAAVVALTLSGCGDDAPQAGTVDDESTSASKTTTEEPTEDPTTEEPTEEPTEKPTDSENSNEDGGVRQEGDGGEVEPGFAAEAEGFVTEFMAAYDEAALSGDFAAVDEMYADSCGVCKRYISSFRAIYQDGGRVEGGGFNNPKLTTVGSVDGAVMVEVESTIGAVEVIDADGETVDGSPAEPSKDLFRVEKDADGTWQVLGWTA